MRVHLENGLLSGKLAGYHLSADVLCSRPWKVFERIVRKAEQGFIGEDRRRCGVRLAWQMKTQTHAK